MARTKQTMSLDDKRETAAAKEPASKKNTPPKKSTSSKKASSKKPTENGMFTQIGKGKCHCCGKTNHNCADCNKQLSTPKSEWCIDKNKEVQMCNEPQQLKKFQE